MEKEKKEIWTLIELLNEREVGEEWWELYYLSNGIIRDDWWNILYDYRIISKELWFIKWLVENDKIDQWRVTDKEKMSCWELVERDIDDFPKKEKLIERLLMLLSISDTPIEDLLLYLK